MADELHLCDVHGGLAAGTLRAVLRVSASHPILAGHFPGAPLVPGVLLLQAVQQAWERVHGVPHEPHEIVEVVDVRWQAPLHPEVEASLAADVTGQPDGSVIATGEWRAKDVRLCTFRLRLRGTVH